jgi:hypothetical protein
MAGQTAAAAGEDDLDASPTTLARDLLVACKRGGPTQKLRTALTALDESDLRPLRTDHRTALAFWLNCYNAGTQLLLDERPDLYENPLRFVRFFWAPAITIADTPLSLNRIENGLLRGGRSQYGLGYVPKLLVTTFEHRHRLSDCDPRIHFALNCGAESCPPIRAYDPGRIDEQLDLATRSYLESTVVYDAAENVVRVPRVFLWFRGDFGGKAGIRAVLREYDAIPDGVSPKLRYLSWDWSKATGKFDE